MNMNKNITLPRLFRYAVAYRIGCLSQHRFTVIFTTLSKIHISAICQIIDLHTYTARTHACMHAHISTQDCSRIHLNPFTILDILSLIIDWLIGLRYYKTSPSLVQHCSDTITHDKYI